MVTMMTMFEEAPMTEKMKDTLTHRLRRTRNPIPQQVAWQHLTQQLLSPGGVKAVLRLLGHPTSGQMLYCCGGYTRSKTVFMGQ